MTTHSNVAYIKYLSDWRQIQTACPLYMKSHASLVLLLQLAPNQR